MRLPALRHLCEQPKRRHWNKTSSEFQLRQKCRGVTNLQRYTTASERSFVKLPRKMVCIQEHCNSASAEKNEAGHGHVVVMINVERRTPQTQEPNKHEAVSHKRDVPPRYCKCTKVELVICRFFCGACCSRTRSRHGNGVQQKTLLFLRRNCIHVAPPQRKGCFEKGSTRKRCK